MVVAHCLLTQCIKTENVWFFLFYTGFFGDDLDEISFDYEKILTPREAREASKKAVQETELEDVLESIGISQKKNTRIDKNASPRNRFWLYDTPGAISDAQVCMCIVYVWCAQTLGISYTIIHLTSSSSAAS